MGTALYFPYRFSLLTIFRKDVDNDIIYIMLLFRAKLQILCVEKKRGYSMKICNFFSIKFRYCEEEEEKKLIILNYFTSIQVN